jgi:hypothetical protein
VTFIDVKILFRHEQVGKKKVVSQFNYHQLRSNSGCSEETTLDASAPRVLDVPETSSYFQKQAINCPDYGTGARGRRFPLKN